MAEYERKTKDSKPVLAICYDFDRTLSPDDMQAQGYIQDVGYDVDKFWTESNQFAKAHNMDRNLAYMYKMVEAAKNNFVLSREALANYGSKVKLFNGVENWFPRVKQYGEEKGITVEHYIISSGLKEMIEGTAMAKSGQFEKVYASSFYFDESGKVKWPSQVINYTTKTQFLFRIQKGFLDINDPDVNKYIKPEDIRIPFRNIVYIGDSDTDIPCMRLVNMNGGHSIGVYNPETKEKEKAYKMIDTNRIRYFAPADYSKDSELDILIKEIINKTASYEILEKRFISNHSEANSFIKPC